MSGEKIGAEIYVALLGCVNRNTSDDEYADVMKCIIHKTVWFFTKNKETANKVMALLEEKETDALEQSIDTEVAEDDTTDA